MRSMIGRVIMGIENVAIGSFSRDVSGVGTQNITGLGFKPKIIIFLARSEGGTYRIFSNGYSDKDNSHCLYSTGDLDLIRLTTVYCIVSLIDTPNWLGAVLTSLDADGFTLTWYGAGSITADISYLAMK